MAIFSSPRDALFSFFPSLSIIIRRPMIGKTECRQNDRPAFDPVRHPFENGIDGYVIVFTAIDPVLFPHVFGHDATVEGYLALDFPNGFQFFFGYTVIEPALRRKDQQYDMPSAEKYAQLFQLAKAIANRVSGIFCGLHHICRIDIAIPCK